MDLNFIYTDSTFKEIGVLNSATVDIEIGKYKVASNDFVIQIKAKDWNQLFNNGSLFYSNDTEFGGMVLNKSVNTATDVIKLNGKTFRGLLEKEYIQPPSNSDYLKLSGEANSVIAELIKNRFENLFKVDESNSGITVNYSARDMNLLDLLEKMLLKVNARLDLKVMNGICHISVKKIKDLSEKIQIDTSYQLSMIAEEAKGNFNHILALGNGELSKRLRVNLYLNKNGAWTTDETVRGIKRFTYKFEDTNQENLEELKSQAIKSVSDANGTDTLNVDMQSDEVDLFDVVAAKEEITGIYFKGNVTKKILRDTIHDFNHEYTIEHKVGDN